jgi:hypothetical protein
VHERLVARGRFEIDHDGELVVVDDDRFHGIARLLPGLGHHDRHALAGETGFVDCQRPMLRALHVVGDRPRAGKRVLPLASQVGAGEHGDDPRHAERLGRVDRADPGVRVRAADDRGV